jgi:hypothetical protein
MNLTQLKSTGIADKGGLAGGVGTVRYKKMFEQYMVYVAYGKEVVTRLFNNGLAQIIYGE